MTIRIHLSTAVQFFLSGAMVLLMACSSNDAPNEAADATTAPTRCAISDVAQCDSNATCEVLDSVPTCTCNDGFTGNGTSCEALDACAAAVSPCDDNAACTSTDGTASCVCDSGWDGDGTTCTNVDECSAGTSSCDVASEDCVDNDGGFDCVCKDGFTDAGAGCVIDPATFVADISSRPATIEISGVGTYEINGLGRVAVEVAMTSTPGAGIIVERVPTAAIYHNITLRNLAPVAPATLSDLATWAAAGTTTTATLHLDGLGTELLDLSIVDVAAATSDVTITDGQLAEVVLSERLISFQSMTLPAVGSTPLNATDIEIAGITSASFPSGDISTAATNTAEPITVRSVANYTGTTTGNAVNFIGWMVTSITELESTGDISRRNVSQIFRNAAGVEIDRIACFEIFPSELVYFNPLKVYGSTQLIDVTIATEQCLSFN